MSSAPDIVALVAHELKHPLAAIEVALPLMADAPDAESRQRARCVIERQLAYLRRLVGDLLDAERARRGDLRLERQPIDLRAIVADAAGTFRVRARERGVTLSESLPPEPVSVFGDVVRLQQVVANLLDNAVRHTNDGDVVEVRVTALEGEAVVAVKDTGEGIASDVLPQVFEPFRRGPGGGLGIGLNVARRLVELHGGRITAHSAGIGHGAEFVIALPLSNGVASPADGRGVATLRRQA